MALTGSVKRSNFQGATYRNWCRKQFEVLHCQAALLYHTTHRTWLRGHTGQGHRRPLQVAASCSVLTYPRLLPDCLLIFSLQLKFKFFFPSSKARIFTTASWQHFARDGSLVLEYLKAVFQTPGVSLTCKYKIEVSAFLAQFYHLQSNWSLPEYITQLEKPADKRVSLWAWREPAT